MKRKLLLLLLLNFIVCAIMGSASIFASTSSAALLQKVSVSGTVTALTDGLPLTGVVVTEKGTSNSVLSDAGGNYKINVSGPDAVLEFSYLGYNKEEMKVGTQTTFNIALIETIQNLSEVVVVGYGVVKKSEVTGSIAQVKSDQIQNTASAQVASALQGKAAGVFVLDKSGKAGGDVDINIRGVTSLSGVGPLWVVDGVPSNSNSVNTNDIETIDIVKDAATAAIYGVKASGGVIMVTTKRGIGEKKPKISFNAYYGISDPWRLPKMVNSDQYLMLKAEQWDTTSGDQQVKGFTKAFNDSLKSVGKYYSTDWMKQMFKTGTYQNYDLSVSGATASSNYYLGLTYLKDEASFIDNTFNKYSLRINSDYKIISWLKGGESLNLRFSRENPVSDGGRYFDNIFRASPLIPVYDNDNQPGGYGYLVNDYYYGKYQGGNPLATQLSEKSTNDNYGFNGNFYLMATVFDGLTIKGTMAGAVSFDDNNKVNYPYFLSTGTTGTMTSSIYSEFKRHWDMLNNIYANYTKDFGIHSVNVTVGYEASQYADRNLNVNGPSPRYGLEIIDVTDKGNRSSGGSEGLGRTLSQFGRFTYTFDKKYIISGIVRRDGSDKFGPSNKYGIFPSLSVAWKVNEEKFLKNIEAISILKLKANYGVNGSDNIGQFRYATYLTETKDAYPYGARSNQIPYPGVRPSSSMANPDIQWERSVAADLGMELGLLKNKIFIDLDFYQKTGDKMLYDIGLPFSSGLGQQYDDKSFQTINAGKIVNNGFEVSVTFKDYIGELKYGISANVSSFKWKVKQWANNVPQMTNGVLSSGVTVSRTEVGSAGGLFYGFIADGIYQSSDQVKTYNENARARVHELNPSALLEDVYYTSQGTAPGDLIYRDINHDGVINDDDKTIIGNPWPKAIYGLQLTLDFKWFDFLLAGSGIYKRDLFNATRVQMYQFNSYDYSTSTKALERWTSKNNSTTDFRISPKDPNGNKSRPSSWYVEDGSFFRIKNIQIGFTLPKSWIRPLNIDHVRLYASGQNIYTWTKYTGMDPEFGIGSPTGAGIDQGSYPQSKKWLFGLQFDF